MADNHPKKYRKHIFDSVPEAVAYARKGSDYAKGIGGYWASDRRKRGGDDEWAGASSFAEAEQLALHGWSAQRPGVDALLEPIREKLAEKLDTVIEQTHDLTGYEPNIDLYLDNELECMIEDVHYEAPKTGKVFNLVVNTTVNCSVQPETMRARGAAICALVEAFQMLGLDMNIWAENTHDGGWYDDSNIRWSAITRIHRAGENLDIDNVMFPLGNPAWLRRLVFGMMENEADTAFGDEIGVGSGYGRAVGVMHAEELEASFVLSLGESDNKMVNDPVGWVLDQLLAQGVWGGGS